MLNYGLVSTAIGEDRQQLRDAMHLLADIAHKHNIPVSWAITADSAQFLAKDLTDWHTEYRDETILMLDIKSLWLSNWLTLTQQSEENFDIQNENINTIHTSASVEDIAQHLVKMRQELPRYIKTEWKKIERALDWAAPSIAGAEWKNSVLVYSLEQLGFRGLWGYRWNERRSIAEVDRGCPFGFFYPSADQHNFSAPAAGNITGIPYNTSSHLKEEEQNLRASLINSLLQQNFDLYVDNVKWNRWFSYVEHINSLDVAQLGQETLELLDTYLAHVVGTDNIKMLPLSEMVDDYWENCQQTEPTFVVTHPLESKETTESNASSEQQTSNDVESEVQEKHNKVFLYYDAECQLTFVDGTLEPVDMKNYISPPVLENIGAGIVEKNSLNHGMEYHLPKVVNFKPNRKRSRLHITFSIESTKAMPYGVAVWGNHIGLQLAQSNAKTVTWIDKYLLFIRLTLETGNNDFEIILSI